MWTAEGPWGRRRFIESIGLGVLAHTAKKTGKKPPPDARLRAGRENLAAILRDADAFEVELACDGERVPAEAPMIEAMNIGWGGPRLALAAEADPEDAMLDVAVLDARRRLEMVAWLEGSCDGAPPLRTRRARHLAFTWHELPLHVDDALPDRPKAPVMLTVARDRQPAFVLVPR